MPPTEPTLFWHAPLCNTEDRLARKSRMSPFLYLVSLPYRSFARRPASCVCIAFPRHHATPLCSPTPLPTFLILCSTPLDLGVTLSPAPEDRLPLTAPTRNVIKRPGKMYRGRRDHNGK